MNALIIMALSACYAMIFLDMSGVAVVLPKLQQSMGLSLNTLAWVMNSFMLTTAVLLLPGGRLADKFGARRIFLLGIIIFVIASILCALALGDWSIISGRILQGVGASFLMPTIVILIQRSFPDNQYGKAFGTILIFSNFIYAVGPFIGGLLAQYLSWRGIFWINLPIGLICYLLTLKVIRSDVNNPQVITFDVKGMVVFMFAVSALVYALMQGEAQGWLSPWIYVPFVFSILGIIVFVKIELGIQHPLLEIRLFQNKVFANANIILFCGYMSFAAILFFPFWLHRAFDFSPMMLGVAMLPATVPTVFMPRIAGAWRDCYGARPPMLVGAWLTVISFFWLFFTANTGNYALMFFGLLAYGFGLPTFLPNCVMVVMSSVGPEHQGMASGVFSTLRNVALTIGYALISVVITGYNARHLVTNKETASFVYIDAFSYGMLVVGLFALLAAILVTIYVPAKKDRERE